MIRRMKAFLESDVEDLGVLILFAMKGGKNESMTKMLYNL